MKHKVKHKIILAAARRLVKARNTTQTLIQKVEHALTPHGVKRVALPYPNPREYRKAAGPELLDKVQHELEKMGFKFRRLPIHTMDTKAVESEGSYQSVDYILDLVFRYDQLEVDLYY